VRLEVVRVGYNAVVLEQKRDELLEAERRLRLEESRLESPQRVASRAREELEMVEPRLDQLVFLDEAP
jgi:cell division protein FtsL